MATEPSAPIDLMYAMIFKRSCSLIWSWNDGITGS